jgi:predicted nuclease of predicted toxin-antitoxin system
LFELCSRSGEKNIINSGMKLLFDHNLSPRLVSRLADIFPESNHVDNLGLAQVDDSEIWVYAQNNDFAIATKDSDYNELLMLRGFPPKIIWIRRGNCSTSEIEAMLRTHINDIQTLFDDSLVGILTLY